MVAFNIRAKTLFMSIFVCFDAQWTRYIFCTMVVTMILVLSRKFHKESERDYKMWLQDEEIVEFTHAPDENPFTRYCLPNQSVENGNTIGKPFV